jgi:hypothetical protein
VRVAFAQVGGVVQGIYDVGRTYIIYLMREMNVVGGGRGAANHFIAFSHIIPSYLQCILQVMTFCLPCLFHESAVFGNSGEVGVEAKDMEVTELEVIASTNDAEASRFSVD